MVNASPTKQAGITLADVRTALGDTNPFDIGGAALRVRLGRGSLETIQRHIKSLREEQAAAVRPADDDVPAPDNELVRAIWSAAWSMAREKTLLRLDSLSVQRDNALAHIVTLESDSVSLAQALDREMELADRQRQETAAFLAVQQQEVLQTRAAAEGFAQKIERLRAENQRIGTEAEHHRVLADRDAQLKDISHKADREHLLNQLAELKSALHTIQNRTPSAGVTPKVLGSDKDDDGSAPRGAG